MNSPITNNILFFRMLFFIFVNNTDSYGISLRAALAATQKSIAVSLSATFNIFDRMLLVACNAQME